MSTSMNRRVAAVLVTLAALLVGALAVASQAPAATYYACIKKDGSAHIYLTKPKCKRGQSKLS